MLLCCLDGNQRSEAMPTTWIVYPDAHRDGGIAKGALDVTECQSSCFNDKLCISIDWVAGAAGGEQCWYHYSSVNKITPISGATHYELRRSTVGWWKKSPNTDANGGTAVAENNLHTCKEWCATNGAVCNYIDWNPTASQGQKCSFHRYIYGRTTSQSVTLYNLVRAGTDGYCGK